MPRANLYTLLQELIRELLCHQDFACSGPWREEGELTCTHQTSSMRTMYVLQVLRVRAAVLVCDIQWDMPKVLQSSHNQPCGDCRFAQLCEIGPIDFFRSLYVDSTIQGDFGHVVRSSVGCLDSEIFWVMCLNLHIPDNAENHCFEHKSQFLKLKYWDSASSSNTLPKEREFRVP